MIIAAKIVHIYYINRIKFVFLLLHRDFAEDIWFLQRNPSYNEMIICDDREF
jgi:hypothetical protein